jgi:hypothetical protein
LALLFTGFALAFLMVTSAGLPLDAPGMSSQERTHKRRAILLVFLPFLLLGALMFAAVGWIIFGALFLRTFCPTALA